MKKLIFVITAMGILASCKPILYTGNYGEVNQTQVVLSNTNFNVLGSFKGSTTQKKSKMNIKGIPGLISEAKTNLLANAKSSGVELTGSRTLVNVGIDVVQNSKNVTVTMSAEIIEFTK